MNTVKHVVADSDHKFTTNVCCKGGLTPANSQGSISLCTLTTLQIGTRQYWCRLCDLSHQTSSSEDSVSPVTCEINKGVKC